MVGSGESFIKLEWGIARDCNLPAYLRSLCCKDFLHFLASGSLFHQKWAPQSNLLATPLIARGQCCLVLFGYAIYVHCQNACLSRVGEEVLRFFGTHMNSALQSMGSWYLLSECVNHNVVIGLLLISRNPSSGVSFHQNTEVWTLFLLHCSS